jgi:hypothetical protein
MMDKPIVRDPRHHRVSVVDTLSALVGAARRTGVGDFFRRNRAKMGRIGHGWMAGYGWEHSKNVRQENLMSIKPTLLGHVRSETGQKYYNQARMQDAGKRFAVNVSELREGFLTADRGNSNQFH